MKLISLNIENNLHLDTVLEFLKIERPDIVCLQELLEEDFHRFENELEMDGVYILWSYWNNLENYPQLTGKKQGVGIFAKDIIDSGSVFYVGNKENMAKSFEEYSKEKEFQKNRAFVWANVKDSEGEVFKFVTTQLPVTNKGEVTPFQLEAIEALLKELKDFREFVLCGDTNAPRGGAAFRLLAEKYKDNIPEEYKTSIDQNLHRVKGIQFVVDCLFTTPGYEASSVRLTDGVSDHMAVVAEISKTQVK